MKVLFKKNIFPVFELILKHDPFISIEPVLNFLHIVYNHLAYKYNSLFKKRLISKMPLEKPLILKLF